MGNFDESPSDLASSTSSQNDPTCLLLTQLFEFNPAIPENKIKACTS